MSDEPKISGRYRELPREEPPRALDDAILAASRRAVDAHPAPLVAPTGRRRWYFPVAAAAVITLVVAVTVQVERQTPDDETVVASASPRAEMEQRAAEAPPAAPERPKPAQKPARSPQQFTPEPPPVAQAPQSAPPASQSADASRDLAKSSEQAASAPAARAAPEALAEASARSDTVRNRAGATASGPMQSSLAASPEVALERIAELRKQGKHEEADKALAEFRTRYPDYRVSDEMKAKVEKRQ
jgi:hypothetical protein